MPPALDGLRISLITDIHHSRIVPADDVVQAIELAMSARPDLIVLGGDYVTFGDRAFVGPVAELLGSLQAPHGVFAILGNHDDDRDMPAALAGKGFVVLKDQRTQLSIRGETLTLAGIRFWTTTRREHRPHRERRRRHAFFCSRTIRVAWWRRRVSRCRRSCPAIRTADRSCCLASARSRGAVFLSGQVWVSRTTRRSS